MPGIFPRWGLGLAAAMVLLLTPLDAARVLEIYFVDVEGGQSTLIVTPAGQTILVDAGFAGDGTFTSVPGDPHAARDANRVLAAARDAGVRRIDFLVVTHFHADHVGGVTELASLIPIGTFVDHDRVLPEAENVGGTLQAFAWYAAVRAKGSHLNPAPGDRLPLTGVDAVIVSSAGKTIARALGGAGARNASCGPSAVPPQEPNENPRSTGFRLQYGKFRFLDVGDLTGSPLFALACPNDMVGPVDVYLVAHHGGPDAADPATFSAFRPRVAIVNNGARKGGDPVLLAMLRHVPGLDGWQLHRSVLSGADNAPDLRIANLDDSASHWIKVSAHANGSFSVTNGRTGLTKNYAAR